MNLTAAVAAVVAAAAAVALAVWEIRASQQQIGRTLTSVKQGQISDAKVREGKVVSIHH